MTTRQRRTAHEIWTQHNGVQIAIRKLKNAEVRAPEHVAKLLRAEMVPLEADRVRLLQEWCAAEIADATPILEAAQTELAKMEPEIKAAHGVLLSNPLGRTQEVAAAHMTWNRRDSLIEKIGNAQHRIRAAKEAS
jgi:hypothetical protein